MQEHFGITQSCIGKCVVQHTALASVKTDGRAAPGVDGLDIAWPHTVVVAFLDIAFWSEYLLESSRSIENDTIRTVPEFRACYSSTN